MSDRPVVTRQDIVGDLRALGIAPGDGLFVHASMGAIGRVLGGARSMVEALLDAVGEAGLLAMLTASVDAKPAAQQLGPAAAALTEEALAALDAAVPGYDPARSPTAEMGAIAEAFRTWPGVRRSAHPTTSVAALGPDAASIVARHPLAFATGPDGPFGPLARRPRMKILLIGVGWNRCTALHAAETLAPLRRMKTRRCLADTGDGSRWHEVPDVANDEGRLFPAAGAAFEATGAVVTGRVGAAECRLCGFADLIAFAAPWLGAEIAAGRGVAGSPVERRLP